MRLIDANEIKYTLQSEPGGWGGEPQYIVSKEEIDKMTTVDAVEVVHGRWVYEDVDFVCSECGSDAMLPWNKPFQIRTNYCPNCGAKMEVEPQCQTK